MARDAKTKPAAKAAPKGAGKTAEPKAAVKKEAAPREATVKPSKGLISKTAKASSGAKQIQTGPKYELVVESYLKHNGAWGLHKYWRAIA